MGLFHMVAYQLQCLHNRHLHVQALDWYTNEFSLASLSHMSQDKLAIPTTQTSRHQLRSNKNIHVFRL